MLSDKEIIEKLQRLSDEFTNSQSDVLGQIMIAYPSGVPIANTWQGEINPILVGALSAAVKLTFRQLCFNLKKGNINKLILNNELGRVIIQNAGPKAILTTIIDREADIFRIAFGIKNMAYDIETLIDKLKKDLDMVISIRS